MYTETGTSLISNFDKRSALFENKIYMKSENELKRHHKITGYESYKKPLNSKRPTGIFKYITSVFCDTASPALDSSSENKSITLLKIKCVTKVL